MESRTKITFYVMLSVTQFFFWVAVALVAIYYEPTAALSYSTPISLSKLYRGMWAISLSHVGHIIGWQEILYLINVALTLFVFIITASKKKSYLRFLIFLLQGVILYWGWVGVIMIPYSLIEGVDGEWLAEHSPILIAVGLWILCSLYMAAVSLGGVVRLVGGGVVLTDSDQKTT